MGARLLIAVVLLSLMIGLSACKRTERPFAGDNRTPSDAPKYSVEPNPNGPAVAKP